jgi:hypothetical protein
MPRLRVKGGNGYHLEAVLCLVAGRSGEHAGVEEAVRDIDVVDAPVLVLTLQATDVCRTVADARHLWHPHRGRHVLAVSVECAFIERDFGEAEVLLLHILGQREVRQREVVALCKVGQEVVGLLPLFVFLFEGGDLVLDVLAQVVDV